MTTPYNFRIMAALPGHKPVELFRSRAVYSASYFNAVTRDFSSEWDLWVEWRMPDFRTLGGRIKFVHKSGSAKLAFHLTPQEKAGL